MTEPNSSSSRHIGSARRVIVRQVKPKDPSFYKKAHFESLGEIMFCTPYLPCSGVPLDCILLGVADIMQNPDCEVFAGLGVAEQNIKVFISWPGYAYLSDENVDLFPGGKPITRRKLALEIARTLSAFVSSVRCTTYTAQPDRNWVLGGSENKEPVLSRKCLWLRSLRYCFNNIFAADVIFFESSRGVPLRYDVAFQRLLHHTRGSHR